MTLRTRARNTAVGMAFLAGASYYVTNHIVNAAVTVKIPTNISSPASAPSPATDAAALKPKPKDVPSSKSTPTMSPEEIKLQALEARAKEDEYLAQRQRAQIASLQAQANTLGAKIKGVEEAATPYNDAVAKAEFYIGIANGIAAANQQKAELERQAATAEAKIIADKAAEVAAEKRLSEVEADVHAARAALRTK